jgi:glycosyltransferase involved in cell wall biosynthesis
LKPIFHIVTTINRGGAENQLLVLVSEQIRKGYKVSVVYLKGEAELRQEFEEIGAKVVDSVSAHSIVLQPFAIANLLSKENVIVHAHLPRAELVSLLIPAKLTLITTRHNAEPFFPSAPKLFSNLLARLVEMRAKEIIAISDSVKDFIIRRGEVKNSHKVKVVHYGYEIKNRNRSELLVRLRGNTRLGTVSRLAEQKDLPTMIDAFKEFKSIVQNATLSIVGGGPLEVELRGLVKSLGLEKEVFFIGRRNDVLKYLSSLDVFLLTSKYEGFGMVLLEAMDAGLPIVASRNTAIIEVMGPNFPGLCETGNSTDFTSKILKLEDSGYREAILEMQESRLTYFQASTMVEKVIDSYFA